MQKPITFSTLFISALVFVLALGYSTDLYGLYPFTSNRRHLVGAELYYDVQPFNKTLLALAVVMIILSVALFATLTHRRRIYYKSNYITQSLFAVCSLFVGVYTFVNSVVFKVQFLKIDFVAYKALVDEWGGNYTESVFFFDSGMVIGALCVVVGILVCLNMIFKVRQMKKEKDQTRVYVAEVKDEI